MPELGRAALVVTLRARALRARRRRLRGRTCGAGGSPQSAQNALLAAFGATLVASVVLLAALARHDFSFAYVADHTSRELPTRYTLSAFWGGQEGSLLLWLLVLTGYAAAAVLLNRPAAARDLLAGSCRCSAASRRFFAFLLVVVASPFATQAAPADGARAEPEPAEPVHDRSTRRCSTSATSG